VLELLLKWLRRNGIREVFVTTGYLGHLIRSFCGDGDQWNMKITYTEEVEPLGTIGPLSLLRNQLDSPFLVLNGDVLTDLSLN
uniref:nucleotidyltransferase family protein n=1 Tax=Klebsiella aerogenes TaxID=548 RepID=UPI00222FF38C